MVAVADSNMTYEQIWNEISDMLPVGTCEMVITLHALEAWILCAVLGIAE